MRSVWIACVALMTAFSAGAEEPSPDSVIFGRWANPKKCNPQVSTKVELTELISKLETYRNTCVTTSGFKAGRALFVDKSAAKARNDSDARYADGRLGLYGSERTMIVLNKTGDRSRIYGTGLVWTCNDLSENGAVMVMGYCHYTGGPIIGMASFTTHKK
jgi:hypothetical protein